MVKHRKVFTCMICSSELSSKQSVVSHIKRLHNKEEVDEEMFCVSTNLIIDNFEKVDQVKDNLKVNPSCEVKKDEKQPKKQNYLQNLMDIFDEPGKLEKLKLYPERPLKHNLSTANMTSQVPVTTNPATRPVASPDEVSHHSQPGKLNYSQFCQRARKSIVDTDSSAPVPRKPKQFSVPLIHKSRLIQNEVSNVKSRIEYSVPNVPANRTAPCDSPTKSPSKFSPDLEPTLTPPPPCSPATQSDHSYTARTKFLAPAKLPKRCDDCNCGPCFAEDCGTCSHCMNRGLR